MHFDIWFAISKTTAEEHTKEICIENVEETGMGIVVADGSMRCSTAIIVIVSRQVFLFSDFLSYALSFLFLSSSKPKEK